MPRKRITEGEMLRMKCWGRNVKGAKHPTDEVSPGRNTGGETRGAKHLDSDYRRGKLTPRF